MNAQTVVIIGGSSGMGLATATLMSQLGYDIIIASRSKEKLDKATLAIGKGTAFTLDASSEESVQEFFSSIPTFHHLVISAADFVSGPFLQLSIQEARRFFDSKFWAQYTVAKYGAKKIQKDGSITFFSGILSQKPGINLSVAASINAAVEGLTRSLALELAPIRVNAIAPGTIHTPVWDTIPEKNRLAYFEKTSQTLPVRRIGQPEDIAQVAQFLIKCGYMTGEVIRCDGGALLL
ncbi:MAG: SDR family oxidoreductase [Rhabdochlamydiaceae bacterium]|nr:SDR family oxidoreductase [Rhabdochlamydiaceae bacterium]